MDEDQMETLAFVVMTVAEVTTIMVVVMAMLVEEAIKVDLAIEEQLMVRQTYSLSASEAGGAETTLAPVVVLQQQPSVVKLLVQALVTMVKIVQY